ncbi:MAG TPA: transcription antitermination factor NusB [Candidatus Syntrophosphaera sp.]|nr:transcription antitermination factor NusB [Candidatus Syntrophosphaera sp.]
MGLRRKARELAAQTLYALDFAELETEFREYQLLNLYPDILTELSKLQEMDNTAQVVDFADDLVKNVIINDQEITASIDRHSINWSATSLARLDRGILRVAVYELVYTDTPAPVVINEAIEIAKKFCSESSGKLLNGILDAVHKEMQEKERLEGSKV